MVDEQKKKFAFLLLLFYFSFVIYFVLLKKATIFIEIMRLYPQSLDTDTHYTHIYILDNMYNVYECI